MMNDEEPLNSLLIRGERPPVFAFLSALGVGDCVLDRLDIQSLVSLASTLHEARWLLSGTAYNETANGNAPGGAARGWQISSRHAKDIADARFWRPRYILGSACIVSCRVADYLFDRGRADHNAQLCLIAQLQQKAIALETEVAQHRATELALQRSQADLHKVNQELTLANQELKKMNKELRHTNEELMKANSALQKANEEAEAATRAKNTFLANMSHELRTPLSAIVGFAQLLLDPGFTDRQNATQIIVRNGQQLTCIVNDILDLSKVESGHMKIEKIKFSVIDVMTRRSSTGSRSCVVSGQSPRQRRS